MTNFSRVRRLVLTVLIAILFLSAAGLMLAWTIPASSASAEAAETKAAVFTPTKFTTTFSTSVNGYTITGFDTTAQEWIKMTAEQKANIAIVIPATYNDGINDERNVVAIGDRAFNMTGNTPYRGYTFISLDLSGAANLVTIGTAAFRGCAVLTGDLTFPNSVTTIGSYAFAGCAGFTSALTLPNNSEFKTIGDDAFNRCSGLTGDLTIPNSVTTIGKRAFERCAGFTGALTLPYNTEFKIIEELTFRDCTGLTGDLTIPNSVTTIGNEAFYACKGFNGTLTLPSNTEFKTIEKNAFNNCYGLTGSLTIPDSVTTIGNYAFSACKGFKGALTLGTNNSMLTTIGIGVFQNCTGFTGNLTIPNSVTTIGSYAFFFCSALNGTLTLPSNSEFKIIQENAFKGCSGLTGGLTIPNSVTAIEGYAFFGCSGFTGKLTLPNNSEFKTIGSYAFSDCSGFTGDLTIPDSVTTIGSCAFEGCTGFKGKLALPNNTEFKSIEMRTFQACAGLTGGLTIPNSVTTIGKSAFYGCAGFSGDLKIPNSVTTIEESAFSICKGFNGKLTLPINNEFKTIGKSAFNVCAGFSGDLKIPNSVTTIGGYAFYGCSGFTGGLTIPDSVTTISTKAFYGCSGFTGDLTIPDSVTTIDAQAFYECLGFTGKLTLPNNTEFKTIGGSAFYGCSGFTGDLTIPDSVTAIGGSAFSGCTSFTGKLTLPNNTEFKEIGSQAFFYCSSLTGKLTIPNSVTTIGNYAFGELSSMQTVYLPNNASGTTYDIYIFNATRCPIIAPSKTLYETYKATGHNLSRYGNLTYETEVTFNANGGMIGSDSSIKQTKLFGYGLNYEKDAATLIWAENAEYKLPTASKTNYALADWNSQSDGNGVAAAAATKVTNAPTYYAQYDILMYSTTYDAQSGYTITGFTQAYLDSLTTEQKANIAIVIPATYNDGIIGEHNVVAIGQNAFDMQTKGSTTYSGCTFTSLDMSRAVNLGKIGDSAFYRCTALAGGLTIPDSVTTIGSYAFSGCEGFNGKLTLGTENSALTTIGNRAFLGCSSFKTSLIIPDSVTTIGGNAFFGCTSLQTVYLPNNAETTYGKDVFYGTSCPIVAPSKTFYDTYKMPGHSLSEYTNLTYETEATFNANGGTLSGTVRQAKLFGYSLKYEKDAATLIWAENAEYKLPTASKTDYTFADWNSQSDGNGDAVAADTAVTHAPTYYARYAEIFDSILAEGTPNKVVYTAFDVFDATGLTVKAVYKSGFTKTLSAGDYTIAYTGSNGSLRYGDNSVMISYAENGMTGTAAITGLTVNKKQISMPTVARNYIYDGRVKQAPLKGIVSAIMTRDGDATGTNAGDYYVSVTLTDNNYAWAGSTSDTILVKWTIAAAKIDMPAADATEFTYNGQAQTYQLTENAAYSITGNVNTDAGEYEVMVALNNPQGVINYEWTTGGSDALAFKWVIAKKKLAITPSYDTSAKVFAGGSLPAITASEITAGAIAWDTPIDLSVPAAGKAFGWTWTPSDTRNYETVTGVISLDVLAVELEGITVTAQPTKKVYTAFEDFDAAGMSVTAIYSNGTEIVTDYIIINGTSLEAGTTSLTVQYTYGGITKEATVSITVNKLQLLKPTISGSYTYTGYEQTAAIEGLTDKMTAANDKRTNAGVYYVAVALNDKTNYEWIDGTDTDISLEWTIETLKVTAPTSDTTEFTYTGGEQTYAVAPSDSYVVSGDKRTNAGEQIVTIALKDKANTEWKGGGTHDITFTFRIAKADYDMSGVAFEDSVVKEDGKAHKIEATGLPDGVTALYAGTNGYAADGARGAGVYEVTVIFNVADAENYNAPEAMTATLYINLPEVTGGTDENGEATIVIGGEDGVKPGTSVKAEEKPVDEYKESNIVIGAEKHEVLQATEIKLERDGAAVQPDGSVTVRLLIKENLRGYENLKIVYIAPDGSAQDMNATRDGNYMVFEAATLNVYVIAAPESVVSPPAVQSNQSLGGGAIFGIILLIIIVLLILLLLALYCSRKDKNEGFKEFFSDLGGRVKGLFIKDKAEETSTTEESGEHALEAIDAHSVESKTSATELGGDEGAETLEDENKE